MIEKSLLRETISPSTIAPPFGLYSQAVIFSNPSRWLMTSGQLGITIASKGSAIPESALEQSRLCFSYISQILSEAGMDSSNVVRIGAYVTERAFFKEYMKARDEFVTANLPVSTLVIVSGFTKPEFKVEVEVLAAK
ncbi:MAG: RidA family protein [Pseudomonadota bacterium]|nr:RidA family protein [Pseudomonadota bacterium]